MLPMMTRNARTRSGRTAWAANPVSQSIRSGEMESPDASGLGDLRERLERLELRARSPRYSTLRGKALWDVVAVEPDNLSPFLCVDLFGPGVQCQQRGDVDGGISSVNQHRCVGAVLAFVRPIEGAARGSLDCQTQNCRVLLFDVESFERHPQCGWITCCLVRAFEPQQWKHLCNKAVKGVVVALGQ